jgi:hypothetical protein
MMDWQTTLYNMWVSEAGSMTLLFGTPAFFSLVATALFLAISRNTILSFFAGAGCAVTIGLVLDFGLWFVRGMAREVETDPSSLFLPLVYAAPGVILSGIVVALSSSTRRQ